MVDHRPHDRLPGTIEVQPDGIVVGWKVAVILAAFGLGLYVTQVVSPIRKDLDYLMKAQDAEQVKHKEENEQLNARLNAIEAYIQRHEVRHAELRPPLP
jgi:hypothetical protein